jgi:hypothetical protein
MVRRTAPHLSVSPMIEFMHLRSTNRFFLLHCSLEIINNLLVLSTPCASDRAREGLRRARGRPSFGCQNMRKYCTCPPRPGVRLTTAHATTPPPHGTGQQPKPLLYNYLNSSANINSRVNRKRGKTKNYSSLPLYFLYPK